MARNNYNNRNRNRNNNNNRGRRNNNRNNQNRRPQAVEQPPVIPFEYDFVISELTYVSFSASTLIDNVSEKIKVNVPAITVEASKFLILHAIAKFFVAKKTLRWTTGPKLFQMFPQILHNDDDEDWWISNLPPNETLVTFQAHLEALIEWKFENDTESYFNHKDFISNLKKPPSMTPSVFSSKLSYHNKTILPLLPGGIASMPDEEIKRIFYRGMPLAWQNAFDDTTG